MWARSVRHLHGIDRWATARSCQTKIADVQGKSVTTLEGLGSASAPHPIQAAFIQEQVPQCGYCTSGLIMSAPALLAEKPKPTEDEIRAALDGRVGSYPRNVGKDCGLCRRVP
jgi:aerobic-type carbon monoxide dehydrogenase small subunit (CoxS/CutS family)